ncbi:hypothetical protein ABH309_25125 [Chromobacterium piscinae]|uniref:Type III secretion apparatus protein OrgA/MxiK n=1 Tax=Chromobacterium piscinae TaxID=686831 RepID=A0ABV0HDR1_9NEIS
MYDALRHIWFDPIAYIHPTRCELPTACNTPQCNVLNDMLFDYLQLEQPLPDIVASSIAHAFVAHWALLPRVAYLMAYQRHRAALARGGRLVQLPAWMRPFVHCDIVPAATATDAELSWPAVAAAELMAWQHELPPGFTARITLLFPTGTVPCVPPAASLLLWILALQYAKTYSSLPLPAGA